MQYRITILDRRNADAPVASVAFFTLADGEGKYAEAWQRSRAALNGKPSGLTFYSDAASTSKVTPPHGDAVTVGAIDALKPGKAKRIDATAIAAIMANAKLDDAAKVAAIAELSKA